MWVSAEEYQEDPEVRHPLDLTNADNSSQGNLRFHGIRFADTQAERIELDNCLNNQSIAMQLLSIVTVTIYFHDLL